MTSSISTIWVYLSTSPLLWLTATLLAYRTALGVYRKSNSHPLLHPVAVSVAILAALLLLTGTSYRAYFDGAQFVHFLLGPATVALAIPLYQQIETLRRNWLAFLVGALLGGGASIAIGMAAAWLLGASRLTLLSIGPKAVTMPIALGITEKIGGLPSLTAALVLFTGILGAAIATPILNWMKVDDDSVRGFALGVTAHGIGTARAFQVSPQMGAFSGLAMGLSGILTALLLPLILKLAGAI